MSLNIVQPDHARVFVNAVVYHSPVFVYVMFIYECHLPKQCSNIDCNFSSPACFLDAFFRMVVNYYIYFLRSTCNINARIRVHIAH